MAQTVDVDDPSEAGAAALRRGDWDVARARFEAAVAAGDEPAAWEGLSRAAWWQSDAEATFAARERAYRGVPRRRRPRAAPHAWRMWVGIDHVDFRGDDAVAAAWLAAGARRARRAGALRRARADRAVRGRHRAAAPRRRGLGRPHGGGGAGAGARRRGADLELVAPAILGSALDRRGRGRGGCATARRVRGHGGGRGLRGRRSRRAGRSATPSPSAPTSATSAARPSSGLATMHAVRRRAGRARHFFGICRTAYGDVLATHGDWPTAEQELISAMDDLRSTRPGARRADGRAARAAPRPPGARRRGARAFESALPHAQAVVAIGELDLAAGDAAAAADAADRVLRRLGDASPLERFPALELLARARARPGTRRRRPPVAELRAEAERLATPLHAGARPRSWRPRCCWRAATTTAPAGRRGRRRPLRRLRGAVRGGDGPAAAGGRARRPRARGRGPRPRSARRARRSRSSPGGATRGDAGEELTARELDILRLVAEGLGDAQIAGRLFLSPHTVHRHVANVRTQARPAFARGRGRLRHPGRPALAPRAGPMAGSGHPRRMAACRRSRARR